MFIREKIKITLLAISTLFLLTENLLCVTFSKEIIPFKGTRYSLIKFENFDSKSETIIGIGFYFDDKGEKIEGSSFLGLFQLNESLEYENIWEWYIPKDYIGDFTDFCRFDIDDDGIKEIIITAKMSDPNNTISPLFIFRMEKDHLVHISPFDESKMILLSHLKMISPSKKDLILLHEDERTEVLQLTINSDQIQLDTLWIQQHPEKYFHSKLITFNNEKMLVRVNHDILFITKIYSSENKKNEEIFFEPNGNVWDIENLVVGDFNGDKKEELIIGLYNGGINMISGFDGPVTEIFSPSLQFDRIFSADIDNDGKDNLLVSDENGELIKHFFYDNMDDTFWNSGIVTETELQGIKILDFSQIKNSTYNFSYLYPEFAHHGILRITSNMNKKPIEQQAITIEYSNYEHNFDEIDNLLETLSNIDGKSENLITPKINEPIIRNLGVNPHQQSDYIIVPGELFQQKVDLYSVSSEDLNYAINAPEGFRFNLVNRQFEWIPETTQLGFHTINAKFYWADVEITKAFSIYVNDKITILNKLPDRNIIQAGETFQYQIHFQDHNIEGFKQITMLKYPQGASIDQKGIITWRSYESQKDWNDFEINVSDGYSNDNLIFSIFVNHPLTILECSEQTASLGEQFNCKIRIMDRNKGFFLNQYKKPPIIEDWKKTGIYETLILTNETKTDLPMIVEELTNNKMIIKSEEFQITEINYENNKLVMVYTYENGIPPGFSEVLSSLFNFINYEIPNHTSFTSPQFFKYNLRLGPENLFITKNGIIKWNPTESVLGKNLVSFTASDGYYSDEYTMKIFVNDVPKITSKPVKYVNLGETFSYQMETEDKNQEDRIQYYIVKSPNGATITNGGILKWDVSETSSKDEYHFEIGVSDSRDTTFQKFILQINQSPIVKSKNKITTQINKTLSQNIGAIDPEGNELFYNLVESPEGVKLQDGTLIWRPDNNNIGKNNIKIEVVDSEGNSSIANMEIIVVKNKFDLKTLGLIVGSAIVTSLIFILV